MDVYCTVCSTNLCFSHWLLEDVPGNLNALSPLHFSFPQMQQGWLISLIVTRKVLFLRQLHFLIVTQSEGVGYISVDISQQRIKSVINLLEFCWVCPQNSGLWVKLPFFRFLKQWLTADKYRHSSPSFLRAEFGVMSRDYVLQP